MGGAAPQPFPASPQIPAAPTSIAQPAAAPEPAAEQPQAPGRFDPQSEEDTQVDSHRLVTRGMEIIHSPQAKDKIVSDIKSSPNTVEGIAGQVKAVIQRVDSIARKEGKEINAMAQLSGGMELVNEMADLTESVTGEKVNGDDRELAFTVSVQDYLKDEIAAGRADPAELQAGVQQAMEGLDPEQFEAANNQMLKLNSTAEKVKGKTEAKPAEKPADQEVV